jgi:Asp-tRNA(Asn)/Glu-tRNA(Gln) amidotransferase A subunit family amidase
VEAGDETIYVRNDAALTQIGALNPTLNCFTDTLADRARAEAARIDATLAAGAMGGVPFAVKNLFDVAGIPTRAGSRLYCERPPAVRDATAIRRLTTAGAVLVGTLNMDEFAYGFTTENSHYGPTRNPHDLRRVAGGSSGGAGAAVAAGLVPLALGSDTNGSIRVPASFCGVFGFKPTYGRVSRAGTVLFAGSFDHVGPLARSVRDLAAAFDALQGPDPDDPVCSAADFDPMTRDRFLAGAVIPATTLLRAQRFRAWYRERVRELFQSVDVVLAPTTPCVAPLIGQTDWGKIGGVEVFVRAHLGLFTQPLSFIGLPVISVPVARQGRLPLGVQLVGPPWSEARLLRVASVLEATGVVASGVAARSGIR